MSKKTVLNSDYRGVVEAVSIPAEVHERDGKKYASFGSAVPIHSCTEEQVSQLASTTHHYCDILTEQTLAPLGELAYVRLDETTAEKVFINRFKQILLVSSDGRLAQWRCAPTFESSNEFIAGAPIVGANGELLSLVTARRGNLYAISNIEGEGGYFETTQQWKVLNSPKGLIYADKTLPTREELREYVFSLPPGLSDPTSPEPLGAMNFTPCLHIGPSPRITLVAANGRQVAHTILYKCMVDDIQYL